MSTKQGEEGLFVPVTTPKITLGTTDIQATSVIPPAKSNIAQLCVECWEVTHIRQNKHVPSTESPGWVNEPFGRNWGSKPVKNKKGQIIDTIPVDLGARKNAGAIDSKTGLPEHSIGRVGCHMVCANMIISTVSQTFSNPKLFNTWLNSLNDTNKDFSGFKPSDNGINWASIENNNNAIILGVTDEIDMERADQIGTKGQITKKGWTLADSYNAIDAALEKCNMVILRVNGQTGSFQGHYVLIAGGRTGNYTIYDPWVYDYRGDKDTQIDNLSKRYQFPGGYTATYNIITVKQ